MPLEPKGIREGRRGRNRRCRCPATVSRLKQHVEPDSTAGGNPSARRSAARRDAACWGRRAPLWEKRPAEVGLIVGGISLAKARPPHAPSAFDGFAYDVNRGTARANADRT
jgi:hypothetical protein